MKTFTSKTLSFVSVCVLQFISCLMSNAQEKEVYIPKEVLNQDFENPESQWCRQRMRLTPNFTILWEKGFGDDPAKAAPLNGVSMVCDMDKMSEVLEDTYALYRNKLKFVNDNSKCDKYRMIVYLRYSDDRTAWGGSRDNMIGSMWLTPVHRGPQGQWGIIAHEMGHCFQQQIGCDKTPHDYFGHEHGFCEMCSQWGLWHYNNNWVGDELYHLESYLKLTYKPFFHRVLCGHAPYVLEYWGEKYAQTFIGELYREGHSGEDVVTVFKRMKKMNQTQYCDEVFDAFCHTVNLDFELNWKNNRELGLMFGMDIDYKDGVYWQVPVDVCPETYGYNVINLDIPDPGQTIIVNFEGIIPQKPYISNRPEKAGWRYGFVMVDSEGKSHYGQRSSSSIGSISFTSPKNLTIKKLWLLVMGAPTLHWTIPDDENSVDAQWPYRIRIDRDDSSYNSSEITIANAGELKKMAEDTRINSAVSLKINGNLNGTDILVLRKLAGRDYNGDRTNGQLRYLDLSDAYIVDGGERYSSDIELDDSGTKENEFPAHSFQDTKIKRVILPTSSKSIGRYAFGSCKELEEVSYGDNIEKVDFAAFVYSSLSEVFIGNGVNKIESYSFYKMDNLKKISVGSNLVTISGKAFFECKHLEEIVLGENLQSIEHEAFGECSELKRIVCRNNQPQNIADNSFSDACYAKAIVYVPAGSGHLYKKMSGWKNFKTIVEMESTDINELVNSIYQQKNTYDLQGKELKINKLTGKPKGKYFINHKIVIVK